MNMPAIDMIIIIGKIRNIGFLAMSRPPTVIISAIMPTTATIMTNGISFISQIARDVPRNLRWRSCRLTSPPGIRGGTTRRRRTKPCLAKPPPPPSVRARPNPEAGYGSGLEYLL